MKKIEYVDLGLPSGTLWATRNAHIGKKYHFKYGEAMKHFCDRMPTCFQCEELISSCKWEWVKLFGGKVQGYRVTGTNGNSVFFSTSGSSGRYWSTTYYDSCNAYYLTIFSGYRYMYLNDRRREFSVRTVKNKRS